MRTYSELIKLKTFRERFEYLKLGGRVGELTFGGNRWMNQILYHSDFWRNSVRPKIIARDEGCDLAMPDRVIDGDITFLGEVHKTKSPIYIHHLNPITDEDIAESKDCVFDPENMVCVSFSTHQAIHYGNYDMLIDAPIERRPNDTIPWR